MKIREFEAEQITELVEGVETGEFGVEEASDGAESKETLSFGLKGGLEEVDAFKVEEELEGQKGQHLLEAVETLAVLTVVAVDQGVGSARSACGICT